MWFRLNLTGGDRDLSVVVGADGQFYFRAQEVAKLLHYTSPSDFAKRYAYIDEGEVLPIRYHHRPALLFTLEHLSILLREKVPKRRRVVDWNVDSFFDKWYNGYVTTADAPIRMEYRHHANGVRICVGDSGPIRFQTWLTHFRATTLEFYKGLNPPQEEHQQSNEETKREYIKQERDGVPEVEYIKQERDGVPEELFILLNGKKYRYILEMNT